MGFPFSFVQIRLLKKKWYAISLIPTYYSNFVGFFWLTFRMGDTIYRQLSGLVFKNVHPSMVNLKIRGLFLGGGEPIRSLLTA